MSLTLRSMRTIAVVGALLWCFSTTAGLQQPAGPMRIAATDIAELQTFGALVSGMVRSGELVSRVQFADRVVAEDSHEGLTQHYNGVPVWGGDVVLSKQRGVVMSILGTVHAGLAIDTVPTLSSGAARTALETVSGAALVEEAPTLTVLPTPTGDYALTYRATMSNFWTYFIDAHDGHVVWRYSEMRTQSSQCRSGAASCAVGSGTGVLGNLRKLSVTPASGTFLARDSMRPADIVTLDAKGSADRANALLGIRDLRPGFAQADIAQDSDNSWGDAGVVDVHSQMGWVYDYLFETHGYDGINDSNLRMFAMVNPPATVVGAGAFWLRPPFGPEGQGVMAFGTTESGQPFSALDVVGHELTHGVTSHRQLGELDPINFFGGPSSALCPGGPILCDQGRLVLAHNPSGAIGEGFADVIGTAAEFFVGNATVPDYTLGEDLQGESIARSMVDPASVETCVTFDPSVLIFVLTPCPDHYSRRSRFPILTGPEGLVFFPDNGLEDRGGEHMNSTIISHAFYLAVEGGRNRTSGLAVQGVGAANRSQVEQAFFDALVNRLPTSPSLFQGAEAVVQAAQSRFGSSSATTTAVTQAFRAVGLL